MGYIYGTCARKLFYCNKYGKVAFTQSELDYMQEGTDKHSEIQTKTIESNPEMEFIAEYSKSMPIFETFGIEQVATKLDLYSESFRLAIEIKMMYSRKAYYQIAIEKFVFPEARFEMIQYAYDEYDSNYNIPLKADLKMSKVFVGRILTALNYKPPRFPKATYGNPTCKNCLYREKCYSESSIDWPTFKILSQHAIERVINNSPPA